MKKNTNKILYVIIGLVALIVVNTIVFLVNKEFNTAKWINIGFLNLSIIVAWGASIITGDKENHFMNYTRLPIVYIYSAITFVLSTIFIMSNVESVTATIVTQIILLGLFIIVVAINAMANNSAKETIAVDKNNYNKINDMAKRLDLILKTVEDKEMYKKIEKAYDSVKNAKLTLSQDSSQLDNDIIQAIGIIEFSVANKDKNAIDEQVNKINNLIIKRNAM